MPSWGSHGVPVGPLGALLGTSWGSFGESWGSLGAHWGGVGGLLGSSWPPYLQTEGVINSGLPPWEAQTRRLGALLGRSWSALGRYWGRLGDLLGVSWGSLGQSWGHLEASKANRKRKGEKANNMDVLEDV